MVPENFGTIKPVLTHAEGVAFNNYQILVLAPAALSGCETSG